MEIKTKYNIGDTVVLEDFSGKFKVTAISVGTKMAGDNELAIYYRIEQDSNNYRNISWHPEKVLKLAPETVDKTQCTTAVTIDIKDVYGVDSVEIPEGYKFKDFRAPVQGEKILIRDGFSGTAVVVSAGWEYYKTTMRIIVEKTK